jgi:hypothetical protein
MAGRKQRICAGTTLPRTRSSSSPYRLSSAGLNPRLNSSAMSPWARGIRRTCSRSIRGRAVASTLQSAGARDAPLCHLSTIPSARLAGVLFPTCGTATQTRPGSSPSLLPCRRSRVRAHGTGHRAHLTGQRIVRGGEALPLPAPASSAARAFPGVTRKATSHHKRSDLHPLDASP